MTTTTIKLSDKGMWPTEIEVDPSKFLQELFEKAKDYTVAHSDSLCAWRVVGEDCWRLGTLTSALEDACKRLGFEMNPMNYNIPALKDKMDYEGVTLEEIARNIKLYGKKDV